LFSCSLSLSLSSLSACSLVLSLLACSLGSFSCACSLSSRFALSLITLQFHLFHSSDLACLRLFSWTLLILVFFIYLMTWLCWKTPWVLTYFFS
jgi:uncharacterized BrkB/YihY/UPF0761 family membrane protein